MQVIQSPRLFLMTKLPPVWPPRWMHKKSRKKSTSTTYTVNIHNNSESSFLLRCIYVTNHSNLVKRLIYVTMFDSIVSCTTNNIKKKQPSVQQN
ncbi:hypothetical protein DsansV1_C29g0209891 [Dioscorea sansibarensis]